MNANELKQRIPIEEIITPDSVRFTTTIILRWLSIPSGAPSAASPVENGAT